MITPLDIENKKFNKQMMNGYNVDEVDEFLDQVMQDYETNNKELASMKNKIEELNNALNHYKNIETTLQNTLVMAQSTAEEVKGVAKQQADQIVAEAQKEAENKLRISKEGVAKDLENIDINTIGKLIENNSIFPNRTNVEFVEIINRSEVKQRTWERGSGETLACGTGASAVCVAGFISKRTESKILNHLLGGDLILEYRDGKVFMRGEAKYSFDGKVKL